MNGLLLSGIILPTLTPADWNVPRESFVPYVATDYFE
jgi:hypothetical protein